MPPSQLAVLPAQQQRHQGADIQDSRPTPQASADPQTAQMFEDVPPGSTFYDFVYRLASRGIMSGYPCGGAGRAMQATRTTCRISGPITTPRGDRPPRS